MPGRRLFAAVVLLAVSLGLAGALAPAAQAHSEVLSIVPADGSVLADPPPSVVLTFTADVLGDFSQVALACDGKALDLPAPVSSANVVTQPLASVPGVAGTCELTYRIVSADSHPIAGKTTFTVHRLQTTLPPTAGSSAAPSPSGTASATGSPSPAASASSTTAPSSTSGVTWGRIAMLGVVVVVLAGALVWFWRSRRDPARR